MRAADRHRSRLAGHGQMGRTKAASVWPRSPRVGAEVAARELVPDRPSDRGALIRCADEFRCDLILTSGGTGFAPDDVTPEATRAVTTARRPGSLRRSASRPTAHPSLDALPRGCRHPRVDLIVNLPGNPASIDQGAECFATLLPHAHSLLRGQRPGQHRH